MKKFTLHQVQLTGALLVALVAGGFTSCSSDKMNRKCLLSRAKKRLT